MRPRQAIDAMLRRLEADLPGLLRHRNGFLGEFKCRAMFILSEAAPEDGIYVQAALETLIVRSGVDV
jgi:hypothetical protein